MVRLRDEASDLVDSGEGIFFCGIGARGGVGRSEEDDLLVITRGPRGALHDGELEHYLSSTTLWSVHVRE